MEKLEVLHVNHPQHSATEKLLMAVFPEDKKRFRPLMKVYVLYKNETLILGFEEKEPLTWDLISIIFINPNNVGKDQLLYPKYIEQRIGKERAEKIKEEIHARKDEILNHPKVRLKRILKS